MATKDKNKKGPATQRTGTRGVDAVGVSHGMTRQEAVKPTPQQAMAQLSQTVMPPQPINYSPGFTDVPGSPSYQRQGNQMPDAPQQAVPSNVAAQPTVVQQQQSVPNGYTYEQAAEGMKRFHGNVDLYHRPVVSSEAMNKAGYNIPSGNTATVYSMQRGIRDANGNVREILYTPISADGQVMSQRDIDAYIDSLDGSDDILAADKAGRNMIIHMDANPNGNDGQDLHLMQEAYGRGPQQQGGVQPVVQQFAMPQQITVGGQTITLQQPQPQAQQGATFPISVAGQTYQVPTGEPVQSATAAPQANATEPTAAERNAQYEAKKQQEAAKEQYNQLVDEYRKAGGNPNAIRTSTDPNMERLQPTAEQMQQASDNAKAQAAKGGDDDKYVKTLMERIDELNETPEKRAEREKREARQRKWAAIAEGIANVFNVGGAIGGAQPARWKDGTAELYANQEAESDKRRAEYRQALMDLQAYQTAIRNGNIAEARAIEEKRKNDWLEYKMLHDQENKAAEQELKKQKQEADQKRAEQKAADQHRAAENKARIDEQKINGTYQASKNVPKKSSSKSGGSKRNGMTPKQQQAAKNRVIKNRLNNLKNKNK